MTDRNSKEYIAFKNEVYDFIKKNSKNDVVDCLQLHEIDRYYQQTGTIIAVRESNITMGDFSDEMFHVICDLINDDMLMCQSGMLALATNWNAGYNIALPVTLEPKICEELSWLPLIFWVEQ